MSDKFFNNAIIGNKNVRASFTDKGELIRTYYPNVDYKQFIDFYKVGIKINDSAIIYLHEDINNKYYQYYTENTNILNTEIENTYFNLKIRQTDFAMLKENMIIRKYTFVNGNKIDLDLRFLIDSKLLSNEDNMFSARVIKNGLIQYNHDFSFCSFANKEISGHRINDVKSYIREGILEDKDYIGMSNESAVSYDLGLLKPGEQIDFNIYIYISYNENGIDTLNNKIENLKKIDVNKAYIQTKRYWLSYLEKHDGLKIKEVDNNIINNKVENIYNRTILLFPLLQNFDTGGISATIEVDEKRQKSGGYSYCWTRDAVFITKAFDYLNMTKETEKFYENFCKKTQSKNGMWEQRFYTDGSLAPCWGYQIDETASVIYGIYEHYKRENDINFLYNNIKMCENALNFLFKYVENIFDEKKENDLVKKEILDKAKKEGKQKDKIYKQKSYDLWEMNEGIHLYSLSSIYGAFNSMIKIYELIKPKYENNRLKLEQINKNIENINKEKENIKKYIEKNMYDESIKVLCRNEKDKKMDISILGTVYPFELFGANEKKIVNTIEKMNLTLRTYRGGYLRFEEDSYIGGKNPWIIATLWMALYYLKIDNLKKAIECFDFATNSSSSLDFLPEQVDNEKLKPAWIIGLGWSHAMYIITLAEILKKIK